MIARTHGFCHMARQNLTDMTENMILSSAYDGLGVSVLVVRPENGAKAVLQLAHGIKGFKERYVPLMEYMASHGIACVANDHRGHGASVREEKDRGYMYAGKDEALVADMKMVTDWAHSAFPGLPVYLLGHSMGSLAARTYLKKYESLIAGLIVCGSPGWNPTIPIWQALIGLLASINNGRMRATLLQHFTSFIFNWRFLKEGPEAWTCSDPVSRKELTDNPLCNYMLTVNAAQALLNLMDTTYSAEGWSVENPELPIYFISGEDDPCMRGEAGFHAAAQMMADMGYSEVSSALYKGMRHEILHEIEKKVVWEDVLNHLEAWQNQK